MDSTPVTGETLIAKLKDKMMTDRKITDKQFDAYVLALNDEGIETVEELAGLADDDYKHLKIKIGDRTWFKALNAPQQAATGGVVTTTGPQVTPLNTQHKSVSISFNQQNMQEGAKTSIFAQATPPLGPKYNALFQEMDAKYFDSEAIMRYHANNQGRPPRKYYFKCKVSVNDCDLAKRLITEANLNLKEFQRDVPEAGNIGGIVADFDKNENTVTFGICGLDCKDRAPGGDEQTAAILKELQEIFGATEQTAKIDLQLGTDIKSVMNSTFFEEIIRGLKVTVDVETLKMFNDFMQIVSMRGNNELVGIISEIMGPEEVKDIIKAVLMLKVNANIDFELEDSDQHNNNELVIALKKYNLKKVLESKLDSSMMETLNKTPSQPEMNQMGKEDKIANEVFQILFKFLANLNDQKNIVEVTAVAEDLFAGEVKLETTNLGECIEYLARCFYRAAIYRES